MENVRKYSRIVLVGNWKQHRLQTSKPEYKRFRIFSEDCVGVELRKSSVCLNKPVYVGAAILDISKTLMYDFWYFTLKERYQDKIQLCFTGNLY